MNRHWTVISLRADDETAVGTLSIVLPLAFCCLALVSIALAFSLNHIFFAWLMPAVWFVMLPLCDRIFSSLEFFSTSNEKYGSRAHTTYLIAVIYLFTLIYCSAMFAANTVSTGLMVGVGLTLGLMLMIAIEGVQERIHHPNFLSQITSRLFHALIGAPQLGVDHVRGHHHEAATPADPYSARMGETFYRFCARFARDSLRRAWRLERQRLAVRGHSAWHWRNETLQTGVLAIAIASLLVSSSTVAFLSVLSIQTTFCMWQLIAANYADHYGLLRVKNSDSEHEQFGAHHAWQNTSFVSNMIWMNRGHHAAHHSKPSEAHENLSTTDSSPKLPVGSPLLSLLVLMPVLWYRLVNPRLADMVAGDLRRVNLHGDAYVALMEAYHRPQNDTATKMPGNDETASTSTGRAVDATI